MGKGDKRTNRGKLFRGSHGIKRPRGVRPVNATPVTRTAAKITTKKV